MQYRHGYGEGGTITASDGVAAAKKLARALWGEQGAIESVLLVGRTYDHKGGRSAGKMWRVVLKKCPTLAERWSVGRTAAIGRRLCEVSVQRPPDSRRRLRVVIEIDHMILERGFLHGDDATVIDHIGRYVGSVAASDIRRANFQRWEM